MKTLFNSSNLRLFLLILGIGLLFEIAIDFHVLFFLLFSVGLIYVGKKRRPKVSGSVMMILGISVLILTILHSYFFKFAISVFIIYLLVQFWNRKKHPEVIQVEAIQPESKRQMIKKLPYIQNLLLGHQRVGKQVYELDDINIQCGFGDTVIDFGMTMLPMGETVVVIRGLAGNIQLLIPYDVEVSINHSVLAGKMKIFDNVEEGFNKNIIYHSKDYAEAPRKLKILTSIVIGDLEVRNV
jgi:lia operon protein LiaF